MIYIFFFLIFAIAVLYFTLSLSKGYGYNLLAEKITGEEKMSEDEKKAEALQDSIQSMRLALRDLDLEHKIGKISEEDFETLKKEMLSDWAGVEEEYNALLKKNSSLKKNQIENYHRSFPREGSIGSFRQPGFVKAT